MFMALEVRVNEKCRTAIKNSIKNSIQSSITLDFSWVLYGVTFMFTDDVYIVYSFLVNVWTANTLT